MVKLFSRTLKELLKMSCLKQRSDGLSSIQLIRFQYVFAKWRPETFTTTRFFLLKATNSAKSWKLSSGNMVIWSCGPASERSRIKEGQSLRTRKSPSSFQ